MSGLSDIVDFKLFEGKSIFDSLRKKPSRLFTGIDPWLTKTSNVIKGSDDKPLLDEWGGTTKENMDAADKAGINTGPGRAMEKLAHGIAAYFAGSYAGSQLGGLGSVQPNMNATNPALIDSATGTSGYGASSAGPGGGGGGLASIKPEQWMQMGQQFNGMGGQDQPPPEIDGVPVMSAEQWAQMQQAEGQKIAMSSKRVKTPGGSGLALARGMRNENPIDANGAQIAAIQELKKQVDDLKARIARAKNKRGARKGN